MSKVVRKVIVGKLAGNESDTSTFKFRYEDVFRGYEAIENMGST